MQVPVTGSSGQIGTNLALRLQAEGHAVIGVDRRASPWTDAFPYLLHDRRSSRGGSRNETINLAYGKGDNLVHAGEVTHSLHPEETASAPAQADSEWLERMIGA